MNSTLDKPTRQDTFKQGIGTRHATDKRRDEAVHIRKQKRNAAMRTRRRKRHFNTTPNHVHSANESCQHDPATTPHVHVQDDMLELAYCKFIPILSDDTTSIEERQNALRVLSSFTGPDIPSTRICKAGMTPDIIPLVAPYVKTLDNAFQSSVVHAWNILINISVIENGKDWIGPLFTHGIVDAALTHVRQNTHGDTVKASLWFLANCIGDRGIYVEKLIDKGCVNVLVSVFGRLAKSHTDTLPNQDAHTHDKELLPTLAWAMSNIFMAKITTPWSRLEAMWPCIVYMLKMPFRHGDEMATSTCIDAAWACAHVARRGNIVSDTMRNDRGFLNACMRLLYNDQTVIMVPALELWAHIAEGMDTQLIVNVFCMGITHASFGANRDKHLFDPDKPNRLLQRFYEFLGNALETIRNDAGMILANVLARQPGFCASFLRHRIMYSICLKLANGINHYASTRQFITIIYNFTAHVSGMPLDTQKTMFTQLLQQTNLVDALLNQVYTIDPACTGMILTAIYHVLKWDASPDGKRAGCFVSDTLEERGLVEYLDELIHDDYNGKYNTANVAPSTLVMSVQNEPEMGIGDLANRILDAFYAQQDMDQDDDFVGGGMDLNGPTLHSRQGRSHNLFDF